MRHQARALARRAKDRLSPAAVQRFPDAGTQLALSIAYRTSDLGGTDQRRRLQVVLADRRGRHPALPLLASRHDQRRCRRDLRRRRDRVQRREPDHQPRLAGLLVDGDADHRTGQRLLRGASATRGSSRRCSTTRGSRPTTSTTSSRGTASGGRSICCHSISTASTTGSGRRSTAIRPPASRPRVPGHPRPASLVDGRPTPTRSTQALTPMTPRQRRTSAGASLRAFT